MARETYFCPFLQTNPIFLLKNTTIKNRKGHRIIATFFLGSPKYVSKQVQECQAIIFSHLKQAILTKGVLCQPQSTDFSP